MVHFSVQQMNAMVIVLSIFAAFASTALAIPLSDVDDSEEEIKRSMLLSRFLSPDRYAVRNLRPEAGLRPFREQKRYRPAMQSRSGGMSLCLWKVCPAAPWLVTKREDGETF